jgi:hypothetical protein
MRSIVIRALLVSLSILALILPGTQGFVAGQTRDETAQPRPIGLQDILEWKRIVGPTLSNDGAWFAYRLSPTEGNSELVVRSTADDTEHRFPVGERGGSVAFSDDSRWLAFAIAPTKEESDKPRGQGAPARNKVGILELATGEMTEVEDIQSFAFAGERGGWIALRRYPASAGGASSGGGASPGGRGTAARGGDSGGNGDDRARGVDLILQDLSTGDRLNLGNVSEFGFDDTGRWLAWAVDAQGKAGNGIQLRDMETGVVRVLESDEARYSRLAWTDDEMALVALKAVDHDDYEDPLHSVVGWTGFGSGNGPTKVVYDPMEDEGFPEGMTISPNRPPRWSEDLDAIFFGIHEVEMTEDKGEEGKEEKGAGEEEEEAEEAEGEEGRPDRPDSDEIDDDEKPELVIWHWKDPRLQAAQQVQAGRDRDFSYLSVYWVGPNRFVRLADDAVDNVTPANKGEIPLVQRHFSRWRSLPVLPGRALSHLRVLHEPAPKHHG